MRRSAHIISIRDREVPLFTAIAGSVFFVTLFSMVILAISKAESSDTESTLLRQRELLANTVATSTAEKVAYKIGLDNGLTQGGTQIEYDPAVKAILITDLRDNSQFFSDFREDIETSGSRSPTILKRVSLADYGLPNYELGVYVVNSKARYVEDSGSPIVLSTLAVACFTVLVVFYLGYSYGPGRPKLLCAKLKQISSYKKKEAKRKKESPGLVDSEVLFARILKLKESISPFSNTLESVRAAQSFLERGEVLRASTELKSAKQDIYDTAVLLSGLTADDDDKIKCEWIKLSTMFRNIENSLSEKLRANPSVGISVSYNGDPHLEALIYSDCVPLLIEYGTTMLQRHIKEGFLRIDFFAEKDVAITRVSINFPRGVPSHAFAKEAEGAIGDGLVDILHHTQALGGSLQIDHVDTEGLSYTIRCSIETRVTGKTAPSVLPIRPGPSEDEMDYKTFYHNFGEGGLRILIVDQSVERMRRAMDHFGYEQLRRHDVRVTFTSDPTEAIRQVEEVKYDCVVIRYGVTGLNAFDFISYLSDSEHDYSGSVKVIAVESSDVTPAIQNRARTMGVDLAVGEIKLPEIKSTLRKLSLKVV